MSIRLFPSTSAILHTKHKSSTIKNLSSKAIFILTNHLQVSNLSSQGKLLTLITQIAPIRPVPHPICCFHPHPSKNYVYYDKHNKRTDELIGEKRTIMRLPRTKSLSKWYPGFITDINKVARPVKVKERIKKSLDLQKYGATGRSRT